MTVKRVLVTGATGAIGPSLVQHLLSCGYAVRTYNRHDMLLGLLPSDVEHIRGDLNDRKMLARALDGVDTVFHLAALLHVENPPPEMAELYHRINVAGTENAVHLAMQADVRRFVYFSTVKVYGIHQREPVSEDIMPNPKTIYAQTKLQGEQIVNSTNGLETVVLRLSAIYGPRLRGSWERMVKAIIKGWFIPIGTLRNQRSLTYVDEAARAACFVAEHPHSGGKVYNVVGHEAVTMREILSSIYTAVNKPMPTVRIPAFAALAGIQLLDATSRLTSKQLPLTGEAVRQFVTDEVFSGAKLRSLGFETLTSLDEGWKHAVEELNKF